MSGLSLPISINEHFETDEDRSYFLVRFPVHPKSVITVEKEKVTGADQTIEPTIPDKPTSRLQKYRLTAKGHQVLKNIRSGKDY